MSVTISNATLSVTLTGGDPPQAIPIGSTLNGTAQKLSDGSVLYPSTGVTPNNITITGTMRMVDSGGTPYEKADRLEQMLYDRSPVTLSWGHWLYHGLIIAFTPTHMMYNEVQYALTLFRGIAGTFTSQEQVDLAARAEKSLDRLTHLAGAVGAQTQAAQNAVQMARLARESAHGRRNIRAS